MKYYGYCPYPDLKAEQPLTEEDELKATKAERKRLAKNRAYWENSRRKHLNAMLNDPEDKRHGTGTGYNYGCRCDRCKAAKRELNRRKP